MARSQSLNWDGSPYRTCLVLSYPSLKRPGLQASANRKKDEFYFLGQMTERWESPVLSWDAWFENRTISSFQLCWVSTAKAFVTFCLDCWTSLTLSPMVCSFSSCQKDFTCFLFLLFIFLFYSSFSSFFHFLSITHCHSLHMFCHILLFCLHPCHPHCLDILMSRYCSFYKALSSLFKETLCD